MKGGEGSICSVLFRIHHSASLFAVPVQYAAWIEPVVGKVMFLPHSPDRGVYRAHGKPISVIYLSQLFGFEQSPGSVPSKQNLIFIAERQIGFLVEAVLSVEAIYPHKKTSPFTTRLVCGVYHRDGSEDIILGLDVPGILSLDTIPTRID